MWGERSDLSMNEAKLKEFCQLLLEGGFLTPSNEETMEDDFLTLSNLIEDVFPFVRTDEEKRQEKILNE